MKVQEQVLRKQDLCTQCKRAHQVRCCFFGRRA